MINSFVLNLAHNTQEISEESDQGEPITRTQEGELVIKGSCLLDNVPDPAGGSGTVPGFVIQIENSLDLLNYAANAVGAPRAVLSVFYNETDEKVSLIYAGYGGQ